MSHSKETEAMAAAPPIEDWAQIPWRKLERFVYRLQKRIYQASCRGDNRTVHSLQRLLMKSRAARTLAVRRVTQDNQGKRTAGIDGVKSLSPPARLTLVHQLREPHTLKAQPTRRVWIPKPGTLEKRPLGIPTMQDRARQALAKLALEPEWEAVFEPNRYGFRPGRSAQDAIGAIYLGICQQPKYVLDADIAGCFNTIAHSPLLTKLHTYPAMRRTVKAWLTAGVLEEGVFAHTDAGTPQGGPLSPLLANIALHGMEQAVQAEWVNDKAGTPKLVRYADDLVILHPTRAGIERATVVLEHWLTNMGLVLKPSKTRVCHTLDSLDGEPPGFAFLGFQVRQYRVGRQHTRHRLGITTVIRPSKAVIHRHMEALRAIVATGKGQTQHELLSRLNPVIRGWANYYRHVASSQVFNWCDYHLFPLLWRWAKRRHAKKSATWVALRYWHTQGTRRWCFATPQGTTLTRHAQVTWRRHVKVRGAVSPFDGNLLYWAQRLRMHPLTGATLGKLLAQQQGKCRYCGFLFRDGDQMEIDHILPHSLGGSEGLANKMVLHRHCHDQRHALQGRQR